MKKKPLLSNETSSKHEWTFLSNHTHTLICLHRDPGMRIRDLADYVGITERAIARILEDLEAAGIIEKTKDGRRNKYKINKSIPLRHKLEAHKKVGELLDLLK